MGYYSKVEGEIYISDPSERKVFSKAFVDEANKNGIVLPAHRFNAEDVFADMKSKLSSDDLFWVVDVQDTHDGYMVVFSDHDKAYDIVANVSNVVKYFTNQGNYWANGAVMIDGEQQDDFSRIVVKNNEIKYEKATVTITFPDGSTW